MKASTETDWLIQPKPKLSVISQCHKVGITTPWHNSVSHLCITTDWFLSFKGEFLEWKGLKGVGLKGDLD